mgnify:CR=1 FL=1
MNKTYYIGLDVHKETTAIAHTHSYSRAKPTYYKECGGSNRAIERNLKSLAKELGVKFTDLKVCYEAGPTGFVLARRLIQLGVDCVICATSKSERKPHDVVKTDKKDAAKVAKEFRNGDITVVRIPPSLDEAVRDVCRARTDAVDDHARAKKRLKAFLLRNGYRYKGRANWGAAHMEYLRGLTMPNEALKIVVEEYILAIDSAQHRVDRIRDHLMLLLEDWEWKPVVKALMACRGFQEVAAMTVTSELGDLRRFRNPRQLMAFTGLVPSEHSSGTTRRLGSITRCGNSHVRWMLVEAAQHARRAPKVSRDLTRRQQGQSDEVRELSWRMQNRLHKRYVKLKMRRKEENKCIIAVAREICGFLWELQNKCGLEIPSPTHELG